MQIDVLLVKLAKPAQRAIMNAGITTLEELSSYSEKEFKELHGIGNNAIETTKKVLSEQGLNFAVK